MAYRYARDLRQTKPFIEDDPEQIAAYERFKNLPTFEEQQEIDAKLFGWPDDNEIIYTDPTWRCPSCGVNTTSMTTCPQCGGPVGPRP